MLSAELDMIENNRNNININNNNNNSLFNAALAINQTSSLGIRNEEIMDFNKDKGHKFT